MNKTPFVLVYDSGIGGLTTLSACKLLSPSINFLYFADTANLPYGNKCKTLLQSIIYKNIQTLMGKYNITHIILACNTATTSSIAFLRKKLNIPIIGTEPNIKTPTTLGFENIILFATPLTIKQDKLISLETKLNNSPVHIGVKSLASTIERYKLTGNKEYLSSSLKLIKKSLIPYPKSSAVVLGCTHYIFLKSYIENMGYKCFDGNFGVARRLNQLIGQSHKKNGCIKFILPDKRLKLKYKKVYINYFISLKKSQNKEK